MMEPTVGARSQRWLVRALGVASVLAWLLAAGRIVLLPESELAANVIVDDALYFAVPARHWWQGVGFSFDGLEPTNGVQALWAFVVLGLAGLIDDRVVMLRAMVATSALCWGGASVLLYRWLRQGSWSAAMLAGVGLAWCGVHGRLAFQGMENGLHALLGVGVLLVATRAAASGWRRRDVLGLGSMLALFGLSRTEGVLLGVVFGLAIVAGWLAHERPVRERVRIACLLAVPGVALVGGCAVLNKVWFDAFLPISGSVKAFYESQWGGTELHGGVFGSLAWHLRHAWNLALAPLRDGVAPVIATAASTSLREARRVVWVALAIAVAVTVTAWRWRRASGASPAACAIAPTTRVAWALGAYALLHLQLMAVLLPHFTSYGTWYFASEATAIWLGLGALFGSPRGRWSAIPLALTITAASSLRAARVTFDSRAPQFRAAGQWLQANVPADTVVGACSAGLLGWYAPSLHIVNLDGLVNTRRYLDEVLRRGGLADYFERKRITWFSDFAPITELSHGIRWFGTIPPERLVPRRYVRIDDGHVHATWQVLPAGERFELLGPHDGVVRDRYVELAVAADLHGRFPIVAAADLAAALRERSDHVVVRSLFETGSSTLRHVVAPRREMASIGLTDATVHPAHRVDAEVAPGLVLLGFDVDQPSMNAAGAAITLFWSCREPPRGGGSFTLVLRDGTGRETWQAPVATCHGTMPCSEWPAGLVVPETIAVRRGDVARTDARRREAGRGEIVVRSPSGVETPLLP